MTKLFVSLAVAAFLRVPAFAESEAAKPDEKSAAPAEMPVAKPGPEHKILEKIAGSWEATVEHMAPGAPPAEPVKGSETAKVLGGLWVVGDFQSEWMKNPFQGHWISGYDPAKKKYVGIWVDTMSSGVYSSEGTYDAATKTMTEWMEGQGPGGKIVKMKAVTVWKDDDTRVFSMYDEGKDTPSMRITYERKR